MISLPPTPHAATIASGRAQIKKHAPSVQTDPQGNSNQWPCVPGILSCTHLSRVAGNHVTSCVLHQVMNPSRAEGPRLTYIPVAMECIDWMQCYSNQSITANERLRWAPRRQQRLGGYGQDPASLSWWNEQSGLVKSDDQAVRWEAERGGREGGFLSRFHF